MSYFVKQGNVNMPCGTKQHLLENLIYGVAALLWFEIHKYQCELKWDDGALK